MKKIVAGNWKMNGIQTSISELLQSLLSDIPSDNLAEIILFPPSPYISQVQITINSVNWYIGGQDVSNFDQGAYTGEVSASMLRDFGCSYVLVGHSERRHIIGESNELVAQKFSKAIEHKLIPFLCVGETLEEREHGKTKNVIANQLNSVLDLSNGAELLSRGIIAYEPVWAIGTGVSAKLVEAEEVHLYIRSWLFENKIKDVPIVYGGSVTPENAKSILNSSEIDGILVGGASLDAKKFVEIIQCIS